MSSNNAPNRVAVLDYLRGLAALSVVFFHTDKWVHGVWIPGTLIGKCGVYAVSLFFVLSGLTLTLVYKDKPCTWPTGFLSFWKKRIQRIFPLLWLATTATLLLEEPLWSFWQVLLNYTGLFGFLDPSGDIALGAWSIGDELVFYAVFPFILLLFPKKYFFFTVFALSLLLAALYANVWLQPDVPIKQQWSAYVQPGNHLFFFLGGMAMGLYPTVLPAWSTKSWMLVALVIVVGVLYFPIGPEPSELLCGWPRLYFSLACFGLVAAMYASHLQLPASSHKLFGWLGTISYGIYLLHPLVFRVLKALNVRSLQMPEYWLIPATVLVTLLVSHVSWHWFEKPLQQSKWPEKE